MHHDPLAVRQRWYWRIFAARYKTKYGVLIERTREGIAHDCYADVPPIHMFNS